MKFLALLLLCSCVTQQPKTVTVMVDGKQYDLKEGQRLEITTMIPAPLPVQVPIVQSVQSSAWDDDEMDMEDDMDMDEDYHQVSYVERKEEPVIQPMGIDFDTTDETIESERGLFDGEIEQ